MKLFTRGLRSSLAFCEHGGSVCDADCRTAATRGPAPVGLIAGRCGL